MKNLKKKSISCINDVKNVNKLISLNNFITKNLLTIDTLNNDDYFFSEKRQIDNVKKIIINLVKSLECLDDLEIAVDYISKAVKHLDELFGNNDYEERLGYIFNKFCIGK